MESRLFKPAAIDLIYNGHNLLMFDKIDEGISKYNKAISLEPENPQVYLEVGKGLFLVGRYLPAMLAAIKADKVNSIVSSKTHQIEINQLYLTAKQHFLTYQETHHKGTMNTLFDEDYLGKEKIRSEINSNQNEPQIIQNQRIIELRINHDRYAQLNNKALYQLNSIKYFEILDYPNFHICGNLSIYLKDGHHLSGEFTQDKVVFSDMKKIISPFLIDGIIANKILIRSYINKLDNYHEIILNYQGLPSSHKNSHGEIRLISLYEKLYSFCFSNVHLDTVINYISQFNVPIERKQPAYLLNERKNNPAAGIGTVKEQNNLTAKL